MVRHNPIRRGVVIGVLALFLLAIPSFGSANAITLNYWHHYGSVFGQLQDELVKEFNATHPGIVVQPQYTGTAWTARDKLFIALAGGGGPDVALIDQFWAAQLADAGFLQKMEDFFPDDFDRDDILDVMWETASYNGVIWTMPAAASNLVLYYNKDLFRAAGLDPDLPPTTWDELLHMGSLLSKNSNGSGHTHQWGLDMPFLANQGNVYYWIAFLWQAGGKLFNEDNSRAAFNSPEGVLALAFWQTLLEEGVMTLTPPTNGWEMGVFGMQIASSARLNLYKTTLPFDFGVAPVPRGDVKVTGLGGNNIAIFTKDRQKQQAAWVFVEWLTSPEVNRRWAMTTGYAPLRHSVMNSAEFQRYLKEVPQAITGVEEMRWAQPRPNIPVYADASRELGLAIEHALFAKHDPTETLIAAERCVNQLIEEYRY